MEERKRSKINFLAITFGFVLATYTTNLVVLDLQKFGKPVAHWKHHIHRLEGKESIQLKHTSGNF